MPALFRAFVPTHEQQELSGFDLTPEEYTRNRAKNFNTNVLIDSWTVNAEIPFTGVSTNGVVDPSLFPFEDEGLPTERIVQAARVIFTLTTAEEEGKLCEPINSKAWRKWSNPELYANFQGIRLERTSTALRHAILALLATSLSDYGYTKARDCMYMNKFLGTVMDAPGILNEWSYNFTIFGEPSVTEPWGWQLHGHHLAMNCMIVGRQLTVSPCFWGAEPNEVDEGPRQGLKMFQDEELGGLALMHALPESLRSQARVYGPDDVNLPPTRRHFADHMHLAGAAQDNRVIPYEGVCAADFDGSLQQRLLTLADAYHRHLPSGTHRARMRLIEKHLPETRFCWFGGTGDHDPFYYRIQSPVTVIEFDHHAGVFLSNKQPQKFHIHTLVRTPNGNDYGMALIRRLCESRGNATVQL